AVRGDRVAGHDEQLDPAGRQMAGTEERVAGHHLARSRAVWHPRGVAEIDGVLEGQASDERAKNGEPADAAVENADRCSSLGVPTRGIHRERRMPTPERRRYLVNGMLKLLVAPFGTPKRVVDWYCRPDTLAVPLKVHKPGVRLTSETPVRPPAQVASGCGKMVPDGSVSDHEPPWQKTPGAPKSHVRFAPPR